MGLAIAVMQPALPALVQRWTPGGLALGTAVYMNGLLMGEFLGAGLTLPFMMPWLHDDWRAVLVAWSLPAVLLAGVVWRRGRAAGPAAARVETSMEAVTWHPPWRDPRMWQLGILLGAASAGFFGANAYMGSVLAVEGREADLAKLLFWFNAMQVAGSLLMLVLARRLVGRHGSLLGVAAGVVLGLVGFAAGGDAILLPSVLLLGLCTCVQLILVVSLVPLITSPAHTGALAAGTFMVGYLLGFGVPMLGGVLADVAGQPRLALLPLVILAALAVVVALGGRFGHGSQPIQHD
jgi:CP family cyanate transporter-like MFS transporter